MEAKDVKVGDVVALPSAPRFKMTVIDVGRDDAMVGYFRNDGELKEARIAFEALVEPEEVPKPVMAQVTERTSISIALDLDSASSSVTYGKEPGDG